MRYRVRRWLDVSDTFALRRGLKAPWVKQTAWCLAILAMVLALRQWPNPTAVAVVAALRTGITRDYDLRSALKRYPAWQASVLDTLQRSKAWEATAAFLFKVRNGELQDLPGPKEADLAWPVIGPLASGFGLRAGTNGQGEERHNGIDIDAAEGTPVGAAQGGIVSSVSFDADYGKMLVIEHGRSLTTLYAHLAEVTVVQGQRVSKGQTVGKVGHTGNASGPHLHFEVRVNGEAVDPESWLPPLGG